MLTHSARISLENVVRYLGVRQDCKRNSLCGASILRATPRPSCPLPVNKLIECRTVALHLQGHLRHTLLNDLEAPMSGQSCLIDGCQARVYAPAGTRSICKDHFLGFLTWRRRRGPQMFRKYAGMTMEERDVIASEWLQTLGTKDLPHPIPGL